MVRLWKVVMVTVVLVAACSGGGDEAATPTPAPTAVVEPAAEATEASAPTPAAQATEASAPAPAVEPTEASAPTAAATEPPEATVEPTTGDTPATPPVEPDEPDEPDGEGLVNADPVLVDLAGFLITTATTEYKAGAINFEVTNSSDTPHEFGIARGASYDDLPQLEDGSIDEEALGADFLGKTAVVDPTLAPLREMSFVLEPGQYVFFCNLVVGPVSHAARGQVLSVTVVD